MSWQTYIDDHLLATNCVTEACIAGIDGSKWAYSEGFGLSREELYQVILSFDDKDQVISKGVLIAGQKYFYLSGNERLIRGRLGRNGVHCVKTERSVIVAVYEAPIVPEQTAVVVENLADHLLMCGF